MERRKPFELLVAELLQHLHEHLVRIDKRTIEMSDILDRLTASVASLTSAEKSAVALLGHLSQMIRDNASNPAALSQLADSIDADTAEIAAAVVANTPAEPAPAPAPAPVAEPAPAPEPAPVPVDQPPADVPPPADQPPADQPPPSDQPPTA